jgi:hypothetical protein
MATINTLLSQSVACGFDYVLDPSFDNLISCYAKIGFSAPCSKLYAHVTATNFYLCGKEGKYGPELECSSARKFVLLWATNLGLAFVW